MRLRPPKITFELMPFMIEERLTGDMKVYGDASRKGSHGRNKSFLGAVR